jgi:MFS family permease
MDRRDRPAARMQAPSRGRGSPPPTRPGPYREAYRDPREPVDRRGPLLTPLRVTLVLALLIGVALLGYALLVQRGQDVPFLAAACAVLGFALGAFAVTGVVGTYRAAADGRGGRAFGIAFLGGLAGIGAFGFLALAMIFGLLWKPPV